MNISTGIGQVADLGKTLINKFFPDANAKQKASLERFLTVFTAQAGIVQAEAASKHWLAANWRPMTMITFVALIVARFFGFEAEGMSEAEYIELWELVKLGLGGYVAGRTVEKTVPGIVQALKQK